MKFTPVTIELEADVEHLYTCIASIQKNSAIMGGYLCDLYLNTDYNDIDIFIRSNEEKNKKIADLMLLQGYEIQSVFEGTTDEYRFSFFTHTYMKNGKKIQLIFSNKGITHVKYFDIRMREFIYFQNQAYASVEALSDISNKMIVMGTSIDPFKAITRAISFTQRYGYQIEKETFNLFFALVNVKQYKVESLLKIKEPFVRNYIDKLLKPNLTYIHLPTFPRDDQEDRFGNSIISHIAFDAIERDIIEAIVYRKDEPKVYDTLEIDSKDVRKIKMKRLDDVKKEIRKKRLFLVTSDSEIIGELEKFCNEEIGISNQTLSKLQKKEEYRGLFDSISSYKIGVSWIKKLENQNLQWTIDTKIPFFPLHQIKNYAKGHLEMITIGDTGNFIYNKKTGAIVNSSFEHRLTPWLKDLFEINKEKEAI